MSVPPLAVALASATLTWLAQAEPAPPSPAAPRPVGPADPAPAPRPAAQTPFSLGVAGGVVYRLPPAARAVPPALGVGFGLLPAWRYGWVGPLELRLEGDFGYARHARTVSVSRVTETGTEQTFDDTREVNEYSFLALQTIGLTRGRWRPWAGLGGGAAIGYFHTLEPSYEPRQVTLTRLALRAGAGAEWEFRKNPSLVLGLRADYTHPLADAELTVAPDGERRVFGKSVRVAATFASRF